MFIGYALTTKQYRLYDPVSKRLIILRDVVFSEKEAYHHRAVGEQGERILHYIPALAEPDMEDIPIYPASVTQADQPPLPLPPGQPAVALPVDQEPELESITVAPQAAGGSRSRMVRELEHSGGVPSGSGGIEGAGGMGRRNRRSNAVAPPVNYA